MRGAWIEIIIVEIVSRSCSWSLPVRGAWIEISVAILGADRIYVAPCEGSVD